MSDKPFRIYETEPPPPEKPKGLWEQLNTPLVPISAGAKTDEALAQWRQEHPNAAAVPEGLRNLLAATSSPLGIALHGLAGGSEVASLRAAPNVARGLRIPATVAEAGMLAHGGVNAGKEVYGKLTGDPSASWVRAGSDVVEVGLGGLGLAHKIWGHGIPSDPNAPPQYKNPYTQQEMLDAVKQLKGPRRLQGATIPDIPNDMHLALDQETLRSRKGPVSQAIFDDTGRPDVAERRVDPTTGLRIARLPASVVLDKADQAAKDLLASDARNASSTEQAKGAKPTLIQNEEILKKPLLDILDASKNRPLTPEEHAAIAQETSNYPKGVVAQRQKAVAAEIAAVPKAEAAGAALQAKAAASDLQANDTVQRGQAEVANQNVKDINAGFKANSDATNGLAKAEATAAKAVGNAQGQAMDANAKRDLIAQRNKSREITRDQQNLADVQDWAAKNKAAADKATLDQNDLEEQLRATLTQQHAVDKFNQEAEAGPQTGTRVIKGVGPNGEAQTVRQSVNIPEEDTDPNTSDGEDPGPVGPVTPDFNERHFYKTDAVNYLRDNGFSPRDYDVKGYKNRWGVIKRGDTPPEDLVAPPAPPKPPKPIGPPPDVSGALEAARQLNPETNTVADVTQSKRPFNQLSSEEQRAVETITMRAKAEGHPSDVDDIADEVAEHLQQLKEGQELSEDAGTAPGSLTTAIRKLGGISSKSGNSDVDALKEEFTKEGNFTGSDGTMRSRAGLFKPKGFTPDELLPRLKQNGRFPQLDRWQDILTGLRDEARIPNAKPLLKDLDSKHPEGWWRDKSGLEPEISDFSDGNPSQTVEAPIPDVKGDTTNDSVQEQEELEAALHPGEDGVIPINPQGHGPAAPPVSPKAAMPFMVTNAQRSALRARGVTPAQYNKMSPAEVQDFLAKPAAPPVNAPADPTMPLGDWAAALDKEGNKPIAPVPFPQGQIATGPPPPAEVQESLLGADPGAPPPDDLFSQATAPQGPQSFDWPEAGGRYAPDAEGSHHLVTPDVKADITPEDIMERTGVTAGAKPFEPGLRVASPPQGTVLSNPTGTKWNSTKFQGEAPTAPPVESQEPPNTQTFDSSRAVDELQSAIDDPNTSPVQKTMFQRVLDKLKEERGVMNIGPANNPITAAGTWEGLKKAGNFINQTRRSTLLSPYSFGKHAVGNTGGLVTAAMLEPSRAGDLMHGLFNPDTLSDLREGWNAPTQNAESESGLENLFANKYNPLSLVGRAMAASTNAHKGAFDRAGFTPDEADEFTQTNTPSGPVSGPAYKFLQAPFINHEVPFSRIGLNWMSNAYKYSPAGLSRLLSQADELSPAERTKIWRQAGLGTAAFAATKAATPTDFEKNHPIISRMSVGSPLGPAMLLGMASNNTPKNPDDSPLLNGAMDLVRDTPGLRTVEDLRNGPKAFARNYLASYTNLLKPAADLLDPEDKDASSKDLDWSEQLFNKAKENVPGLKSTLPSKPEDKKFRVTF